MPAYAAFLRGINVGGRNMVKMAELVRICETAGFEGARSYIQSGNLDLRCGERSTAAVAARLKEALRANAGLDIEIVVKSKAELDRVIAADPFARRQNLEAAKRYVALLAAVPTAGAIARLEADEKIDEEHYLVDDVVYTYYANSYGRSYFNNNLIERRLGVAATSRVWATILEMKMMISSPIASD